MPRSERKRDRTARLLRLQILLWQHPSGIDVKEIARKCRISKRTAYRDLATLETELGVPIWEDNSKRGIAEGYFLPPIHFTSIEAVNIFISIRLMQRLLHQYDPGIASTFMKLIMVVPLPVREQIQKTLEYMEKQPTDNIKVKNFHKLTDAWLSQKRVKILYRGLADNSVKERIIEPYFIEPVIWTHSNHVIAYCHATSSVRSYNINRIIGEVSICEENYKIPGDFDANEYLNTAWSIFQDQEVFNVKLKFDSALSEIVTATIYHPSQKTQYLEDGSLIMTFKIRNSPDFVGWVLGWGNSVEVLEPGALRSQIIKISQAILKKHRADNLPGKSGYAQLQELENPMNAVPGELTDNQWEVVRVLLPPPARTGRPRANDRNNVNGMIWVLRTGARWKDMPRKFGSPSTCHNKFQLWRKQVVWMNIWRILFPAETKSESDQNHF